MRTDLRHALRLHARRPGVTAAAVATLALGIGLNTAIFSIVYGVLRPLDYPAPGELVRVYSTDDVLKSSTNPRLQAIWNRLPVSHLNTLDWRVQARRLAGIGLYLDWTATYTGGEEPLAVTGARVDGELFAVLGVRPVLGRVFEPQEREGVLISYGFWQEVYGGDSGVLGRALRLDGDSFTITGVMPAGFRIAGRSEDRLFVPVRLDDEDLAERDSRRYHAIGRLAPGAALASARAEMSGLSAGLAEAFPDVLAGTGVRLVPLLDDTVGDSRTLLLLLFAAVAVVLLIACANVAQLLLARAAGRRQELAVRFALGAGRRRLGRQLLGESLLLGLAGGGAGLLLAFYAQPALLRLIPADLPRAEDVAVRGGVLAFTLGASLFAALASGVLPALFASGVAAGDLKAGGGRAGVQGPRVHGGFVVAEVALALTLTAVAALLASGFLRQSAVDPGYDTEDVLVQEIRLPAWRYGEPGRRRELVGRLLPRLEALPGVEAAALTTKLPLPGLSLVGGFRLPGRDVEDGKEWTQGRVASLKFVTPGHFQALGIPVLRGRAFEAADRAGGELVVVVNQVLAHDSWPGRNPVGETVLMRGGAPEHQTFRVVGLIGDVRQEGLSKETLPMIYLPWDQPWPFAPGNEMFAVLGVDGEATGYAPAVRGAIRELDPWLPLPPGASLGELLDGSLAVERSRAAFVGVFALLALVLAGVGTYAVTAFTIRRQVAEIGVRMALGASAGRVRALVLRRVLRLVLLGVVLGTGGALAAHRLLRSLVDGLPASDPVPFVAAAGLLLVIALLAGFLPAHTASRVDPVRALRSE